VDAAADYDLLAIGSGPAGMRAAIQAAKLRRRGAAVERFRVVGGACVNTGTIPSKTMREAILHLTGLRQRGFYGQGYRSRPRSRSRTSPAARRWSSSGSTASSATS
jgi:NAD(P) transhydrogenase